MGSLQRTYWFLAGFCCGMYIERNLLKEIKESYKKPGNGKNKD